MMPLNKIINVHDLKNSNENSRVASEKLSLFNIIYSESLKNP